MRTLVEVGLANACAAGLLALLALAAGRWSRRPALVHSLWLLVLVKLVTPPLVALPLPIAWPEHPTDPAATPAPETMPVALAALPTPPVKDQPAPQVRNRLAKVRDFQGPDAIGLPLPQPLPDLPGGVEPPPAAAGPGVEPNLERIARAIVPVTPRPAWPVRWIVGAALGVWAAGALGWFALMAYRIARFQRLLKQARRAGPELQEQARDLARRLGLTHCPEVWLIPGPLPPLLWVIGRARLYFPAALLARLSPEGRASLLVHELAHLARRDHWVRLVELLANGLYWWYPLVWYARRRLQAAEEECCDAWVVSELPGSAPHYAGALLETIDFLAGARPALPPAASGFGRMYYLKRRLSMIVGSATPRSLSRAGRFVILLLAAALLPLGFSSARPEDAKDKAKADAPATPTKPADPPGMAEEPANYGPQSTVLQATGNGQVWSVAVSPDGKYLAVGSGGTQPGGELTLWDLAEGKELAALKEKEPVRWVEYSADGKWMATCGFDNIIKLRDPRTGRARAELTGHPGKINCIRFTPDSKKIISAGLDKLIKVWDVEKAKEIATLTEHTDRVLSVCVSKDGKLFASASGDKTAILWDLETLKPKQKFTGHTAQVEGVALSNDNKTLVTTGFDNTVRFWNAATGEEKAVKRAHTSPVTVITISPDGKYFATAAYGSTLRFWDPESTNEVFSIDPIHQQPTYGLRFTPDNKEIITGSFDKTVKVWNVATQKLRVTLTPRSQQADGNFPVWAVAWSPDGKKIAVAGEDKSVKVLDAATGELLFRLEGHEQGVRGVAFSPDGSLIATAGGDDNTVRLWNASTGQERFTLKGHTGSVYHVAFSPDGQTLASAGYDKTARLWDVTTGLETKVLKGHRASVRSVAWSADGKTLATGSGDKTVKLWDAAKGEEKTTLKGHEGAVCSVAFHPNGTTLASGGEDGTIRLWDVPSAKQIGSARSNTFPTPDGQPPQSNFVAAVAFSPRGRTLVAVGMDLTVHVLDPLTGAQRSQLRAHTDFITSLAFSPDGKTLLTAGLDRSLRRWPGSVPPPTPRVTYQDWTVQAWFAVFSPDGTRLVSGGDDGNLYLRRVDLNRKVPVLQGPTGGLYTIAFTRDGKTMATCGTDTLVRLWELPSGKLLKTLRPQQMDGDGPLLPVWSVAFSPDGKYVASCTGAFNQKDQAGRIQVWDVKTGEEVATLPGGKHESLIVSIAFSPDGKWLATAGWEGVVNVWKADGFAHHKTLKISDQPVRSLCFHPKNGLLAAGGFDGTVRLYDPATGKEEGKFTTDGPLVNAVSFSADGKRLAAVYNKKTGPDENPLAGDEPAPGAVVWEYESKKEILKLSKEIKGKMLSGALSPDGTLLATGGGVNNKYGSVQLWDVDTGKEVTKLSGPQNWVEGVTFSPDGKLLASTGATPPAQPRNPDQPQPAPRPAVRNDVTIWDVAEARGRLRLEGHTKHVAHATFTRDGKMLATAGGADRSIRLWDGETGEAKGVLEGHEGDVRRVAFSPDGKTLYSCGDDHTVRVWDVAERKLKASYTVSDDSVYAMALSPNGKTLAIGTGDWKKQPVPQGTVKLLDPETGKVKATLTGFGREVWSLAFSPDGKYLAAGAGANQGMNVMLRLYDADSGKVVQEKSVAPYVRAVAFSPDGKTLAAGLGNGQVKLFAVEGLVEKATLPGVAPGLVFCVTFSPDGNLLATSANDGGVKLWDVPAPPKAVAAVK